jgi:hypothetical protein
MHGQICLTFCQHIAQRLPAFDDHFHVLQFDRPQSFDIPPLIAVEFFILQVFRVSFYVSTFIHLIGLSQSDLSLYGLGA